MELTEHLFAYAARGLVVGAFPGLGNDPTKFDTELNTLAAWANAHTAPGELIAFAKADKLP